MDNVEIKAVEHKSTSDMVEAEGEESGGAVDGGEGKYYVEGTLRYPVPSSCRKPGCPLFLLPGTNQHTIMGSTHTSRLWPATVADTFFYLKMRVEGADSPVAQEYPVKLVPACLPCHQKPC